MTSMFRSSIILLMIANTIAASGAALVALQTSLVSAPEPPYGADSAEEHFFQSSVSATEVGNSRLRG